MSGTGAYGCQLAKNVFKAGKVITTVSTSKVPQVAQYLGDASIGGGKRVDIFGGRVALAILRVVVGRTHPLLRLRCAENQQRRGFSKRSWWP